MDPGPGSFELIQREAKLQRAAVYWKGFDVLLSDDKKAVLDFVLGTLPDRPALTFLAGEGPWEPIEALRDAPFARAGTAEAVLVRPLRCGRRRSMVTAAFTSTWTSQLGDEVQIYRRSNSGCRSHRGEPRASPRCGNDPD